MHLSIFTVGHQLPDDSYMPSTNDVSPASFKNIQSKINHLVTVSACVCV